jgi:hypothetical protein
VRHSARELFSRFGECPGYGRRAAEAGLGFGVGVQSSFERGPSGVELGGEDLIFAGSVEIQFADADAVFRPNGRPEDAAGDGARGVEIARSGGGVERGTGFVVGEVVVARVGLVELAGGWIAGKAGRQTADGFQGSLTDGRGFFWFFEIEGGESGAETGGVKLRDAEDADAALGASQAAVQPVARAAGGVGCGGIDDLDELVV